jgi:hypothetical protein
MCDVHLALYMFLYVYIAYPGNVAAKSWLALGCNRQLGCPGGHQIGGMHLIWCVSYISATVISASN